MFKVDVFEAIKGRRSIRAFTEEDVSDEMVLKMIEAATLAPSAGNIQPWEFVVVRDFERKRKLAVAALRQMFIVEASVVLVVCANENMSGLGYGWRGVNLYCIQDTAAAIENLLLAVYALGYGACWVGAFNEDEVREVVKTPKGIRPVAIIPIGRPSEKPSGRRRRSLEEVIHHETF